MRWLRSPPATSTSHAAGISLAFQPPWNLLKTQPYQPAGKAGTYRGKAVSPCPLNSRWQPENILALAQLPETLEGPELPRWAQAHHPPGVTTVRTASARGHPRSRPREPAASPPLDATLPLYTDCARQPRQRGARSGPATECLTLALHLPLSPRHSLVRACSWGAAVGRKLRRPTMPTWCAPSLARGRCGQ